MAIIVAEGRREALREIINRRVCGFVGEYEIDREELIDAILALTPVEGVGKAVAVERLAYVTGYNDAYEDCTGNVDHDAAEEGWGQYRENQGNERISECSKICSESIDCVLDSSLRDNVGVVLDFELALSTPVAQGGEVRDALEPNLLAVMTVINDMRRAGEKKWADRVQDALEGACA